MKNKKGACKFFLVLLVSAILCLQLISFAHAAEDDSSLLSSIGNFFRGIFGGAEITGNPIATNANCGDTIVSNLVLDGDLDCAGAANGLIIGANSLTLDCNDYNINNVTLAISGSGVSFVTVQNCDITDAFHGINFEDSVNISILNNNLSLRVTPATSQYGIRFYKDTNDSRIIGNRVFGGETGSGIKIQTTCHNNLIKDNVIEGGIDGIYLCCYGENATVQNNHIINSLYRGIYSNYAMHTEYYDNIIENSGSEGLRDNYAKVISRNFITNSGGHGIYLQNRRITLVYDNYLNNTDNFEGNDHYLNTTKTLGINIINGGYFGGNYWTTPAGNGFSETCDDLDYDGICDDPYVLNTNATDYLPLTLVNITCEDNDGDGYGVCPNCNTMWGCTHDGDDCDDANDSINPGATEVCNGVDDDCDGGTVDGSGESAPWNSNQVGVCSGSTQSCTAGSWIDDYTGIPNYGTEVCDGLDNDCNAGTVDGSGESAPLNTLQAGVCTGSTQSCTAGSWIDDYIGVANYEATEVSCDTLDNDCDTQVDEGLLNTYYRDFDTDTYGNATDTIQACTPPGGYVSDNTDCNDNNVNIHPGAIEACNGVDDDCNVGTVDGSGESAPLNTLQDGVCTGSTQICSGSWIDDYSGVANYEATEVTCDSLDNDCDTQVDEGLLNTYYRDFDTDTYGNATDTIQACTQPGGYVSDNTDCNDNNVNIHPGATEACNGVDDDCNVGTVDGSGESAPLNTLQDGVCTGSTQICSGSWIDDYSGVANYEATEVTCDSLDNDCDTQVDEGLLNTYYQDFDTDSYGNLSVTQQACTQPGGYVSDNTDCDDNNVNIHPGATEVCNGVDDDCNVGTVDGSGESAPLNTLQDGVCTGSTQICSGSWIDDYSGVANYEATEVTCDSLDNDCDTQVDEGLLNTYYQDLDSDSYGNATDTIQACTQPGGYVSDNTDCDDGEVTVNPSAAEVCNDVLDNDCDTALDCDDSDCYGSPLCPLECGDTVMGSTVLTQDIIECTGNGLNIGADNIVLDCAGHQITGDDDTLDFGINFGGYDNVTIKNCYIAEFGFGVQMASTTNSKVVNTTLYDNADTAIRITTNSDYNTIENCVFNASTAGPGGQGGGILLDADSTYNNIKDNTFQNSRSWAMRIRNSALNTITGNTFNYNKLSFLYGSNYNVVEGNIFNSTVNAPAILGEASSGYHSYYNEIRNNTIINWKNSIYLNTFMLGTIIENNNMYNSSRTMIQIDTTSLYNKVLNNNLSNPGWQGIYLYSTNENVISGNIITEAGSFYPAIDVFADARNNQITSNIIKDSMYGIELKDYNPYENVVANNYLINNTDYGIWVEGAHDDLIYGNTISSDVPGHIGIYLSVYVAQGGAENNKIFSNTVTDSDYGIYVSTTDSVGNLIHNNYLEDNVINAYDVTTAGNEWNSTLASGFSIIATNLTGGNFYGGNASELGYSEDCTDADSDNICDVPYPIPGGTNTDNHPLAKTAPCEHSYQIDRCCELQLMDEDLNGDYQLTQNIDCSETANWNNGLGFNPIGTYNNIFIGTLDGQGYTISNLVINRPYENYVGLITLSQSSTISNVNLENINITGNDYVGSLAGLAYTSDLTSNTVKGSVTGEDNIGGLVGVVGGINSVISASSFEGSIKGDVTIGGLVSTGRVLIQNSVFNGTINASNYVGGIFGHTSDKLTIYNCDSYGYIYGNTKVGGIIGQLWSPISVINQSSSNMNIEACSAVGGIAGYNRGIIDNCIDNSVIVLTCSEDAGCIAGINEGTITNSYATGTLNGGSNATNVGGAAGFNNGTIDMSYSACDVSGDVNIGGLVGENKGDIIDSFAVGSVTGNTNAGGLVGANTGSSIVNSYWYDVPADSATTCVGNEPHVCDGNVQTDITYFYDSTNPPMDTWDFVNIWEETGGLPGIRTGAPLDSDNDGVLNGDDKCPDTVPWYASEGLRPNHYDHSNMNMVDTYGCSCGQILYCKPGQNNGELKWGCTEGTLNVWMTRTGWSLDCQVNGIVSIEGEDKGLFENTDNEGMPDILDGDNDNDGIVDSEDSEPESAPTESGKQGKGKPDWWCNKHPNKC